MAAITSQPRPMRALVADEDGRYSGKRIKCFFEGCNDEATRYEIDTDGQPCGYFCAKHDSTVVIEEDGI